MIDQLTPRFVQRHRFSIAPSEGNHRPATSIDDVDIWDKQAVADLTVSDINSMSRATLAKAICGADFPALLRSDLDHRLKFADDETLRRVAFLARQCCRRQGY